MNIQYEEAAMGNKPDDTNEYGSYHDSPHMDDQNMKHQHPLPIISATNQGVIQPIGTIGFSQLFNHQLLSHEESKTKFIKFCRPALDLNFIKQQSLVLMQIDIDYYMGKRLHQTIGFDQAVLRIYGVTNNKNSIMIHVHGFSPCFWVEVPCGFDLSSHNIEAFRQYLNSKIKKVEPVSRIEIHKKESIRLYKTDSKVNFSKFVQEIHPLSVI